MRDRDYGRPKTSLEALNPTPSLVLFDFVWIVGV